MTPRTPAKKRPGRKPKDSCRVSMKFPAKLLRMVDREAGLRYMTRTGFFEFLAAQYFEANKAAK
jgi:hypothetical protein